MKLLGAPTEAPIVNFRCKSIKLDIRLKNSHDIEILNMCIRRGKQLEMKRTFKS